MNTNGTSAPPVTENGAASAKGPKVVVAGADGTHALSYGDRPPSPGHSKLQALLDVFRPNQAVSARTMSAIIAVEVVITLLIWLNSPFKVLPRPDEVFGALKSLWMQEGLGQELFISIKTNVEALLWPVVNSLGLAYLTVIPVFRPVVAAVSKGRFLSLVGFTFIFTLIFGGGHPLKTSLLVFAVTVFYVTSMASVVAAIPREEFDHARTLRMSEWRVVWEVVVLGTADKALEVLRQNAAMGWMMLTMVEGIVRSEGGVGAMLLSESKHFRLVQVFAFQIVILLVGLLQDYGIGLIRRVLCPYSYLTLERQ